MQIDSSVWLMLAFNIGLIMAFSWFGVRLINRSLLFSLDNDTNQIPISRIVRECSAITPRFRRAIFLRRMIKANFDDGETPFYLSQLIFQK